MERARAAPEPEDGFSRALVARGAFCRDVRSLCLDAVEATRSFTKVVDLTQHHVARFRTSCGNRIEIAPWSSSSSEIASICWWHVVEHEGTPPGSRSISQKAGPLSADKRKRFERLVVLRLRRQRGFYQAEKEAGLLSGSRRHDLAKVD